MNKDIMMQNQFRIVPGWMCSVDWTYELGEASGGTAVFSSKEDLLDGRKCINEITNSKKNIGHHPQEVVVLSKNDFEDLIYKYNIDLENFYSSNIGPIIWSKEKGLLNNVN